MDQKRSEKYSQAELHPQHLPPTEQSTLRHLQDNHPIPMAMGGPQTPTASSHGSYTLNFPAESDNESRHVRATSVISMDDLEAAQALEGLRTDFARSPSVRDASPSILLPTEPRSREPLLNLLTSSHPLLSSAINGSVSMYTSSKSNYPKFKYGAEFLERTIGSQVVNTVGSVGRKTGVEDGIRWALKRRQTPDPNPDAGEKRAKIDNILNREDEEPTQRFSNNKDSYSRSRAYSGSTSELSSAESLPPYETLSLPNYEDSVAMENRSRSSRTWHNRLMVSTSGFGVAMSEESLRRLSYCLRWLRWANKRLGNHVVSLKQLLEEYERNLDTDEGHTDSVAPDKVRCGSQLLHQQIQRLKSDVLSTLKHVVDVVSRYAGSALPENARNLVRRHLTSLPQRFRLAAAGTVTESSPGSIADTTAASAHRVILLAEEGLDMMMQVGRVVDDTLVSAESWCQRLRMPRNSASETGSAQYQPPAMTTNAPVSSSYVDVKQPIVMPLRQAGLARDVEMTE
ncbi:hypothetical protein KEM54_003129 [Ascosphaera aggregata]|nr:hypothetical protein KEM54_003129 [Ascosphaera aggregata]